MKSVLVEGHRGYCAKYPENTLPSFAAALELSVDFIEFDVWLTSDKIPVLMHDGNTARTCGVDKVIRNTPFAELRELEPAYRAKFGEEFVGQGIKIPTLEELLQLCRDVRPDIRLGVEIKEYTEETVDLTVALLKKYGFFDTCCFYAFDSATLKYIKTKYAATTLGYPDFMMKDRLPDNYDYYDEIGIPMNVLKSEILPIYINKGFPMHMYCADNEADARLAIEKGASLITANDPVPLMKLLGRIK